jgi:hypothetical protein
LPTSHALAVALLSVLAVGSARAADSESLLLPGIDVRSIDFVVGTWCRYRVIDVALGQADTSEVMLAIVGRESTPDGPAYWLEIETEPRGGGDDERDFSRALVDDRIRTMAADDSIYHFVRRFYVKKGKGPVEAGDPRDLKRITVVSPAARSDWKVTPGRRLTTAAGAIDCELREFKTDESRDVPSGRIVIRQRRSDRVQVWVARTIPVFHLARCEIERVRESKAVPPVQGVPESGPRTSRTTSEIVAYGTGAKARISPP